MRTMAAPCAHSAKSSLRVSMPPLPLSRLQGKRVRAPLFDAVPARKDESNQTHGSGLPCAEAEEGLGLCAGGGSRSITSCKTYQGETFNTHGGRSPSVMHMTHICAIDQDGSTRKEEPRASRHVSREQLIPWPRFPGLDFKLKSVLFSWPKTPTPCCYLVLF